MERSLRIIGIGDEGPASLPLQSLAWINASGLLVGGERQLDFFPGYEGEKRIIKGGLAQLADELDRETRDTVVLASGDPLFYGIGGYLAGKLQAEIYPNVSSVQHAFARIGESWQDAELLSVHGRSLRGLAQRLDGKAKAALLTDADNHPGAIARYLLDFGMTEYRAFVAENLGGETEKTGWHDLAELAEQPPEAFSPLNVVILKRDAGAVAPVWPLGIPDEEFAQRKPDKGLITKREVRVLSLAELALRPDSVVWDIGCCTGSVAIEAAKLAPRGAVYAIEKNEGDLANCQANMRKFRVDLTAVHGRAPEGLETFAAPDAVFIGGTGGEMRELLAVCCARLNAGGRIVLNAVTLENLHEAAQAFEAEGFETRMTLAQLSRSKPILDLTRFEALNPVFIVTAWRREEEEANPR
ncbi:precorrin-6y C5,15-methyltransferase (decarboxylating) subunit CbiE [Paenibacillus methanolicus]|uniref:Precorrin-6Y C5,15-methyltransferase (Decarboxylating) n=1 Tax=Paenibacillus methanolicus TaxID=582686 RepID=A0A5S5BYP6_9BACL|nr:precorrin-6y C5,15-methyltransferase (decarboxylating) subunit CbiE [Paenibacillus methanolicus]TYP71332.1 precorrin-6Y C5,15-methyltransferase (decarboxylating) [Paenibacillus methanolicus]